MSKIELGSRVRDRITGFEGIATATTTFLTGCDRISIQPTGTTSDGKLKDCSWFDAPCVEVLSRPSTEMAAIGATGTRANEKVGACGPDHLPKLDPR